MCIICVPTSSDFHIESSGKINFPSTLSIKREYTRRSYIFLNFIFAPFSGFHSLCLVEIRCFLPFVIEMEIFMFAIALLFRIFQQDKFFYYHVDDDDDDGRDDVSAMRGKCFLVLFCCSLQVEFIENVGGRL